MTLMRSRRIPTQYEAYDVALIGGGIMSATLGQLISMLSPKWSMVAFERLSRTAKESSHAWHNAGTGHAGLCELNYTAEKADGSIDTSKAISINEQFQLSRQFWSHLVREGVLGEPSSFINATPHMTLVHGEKDIDFLRRRHESLISNPLFASMSFSTDHDQIAEWAPLLTTGRSPHALMAATHDVTGTDVNFGALTRQLFDRLGKAGMPVEVNHEVVDLRRTERGWLLTVHDKLNDTIKLCKTRFVFVGAGGYALKMLMKTGLPEVNGYGLFPVAGMFLTTTETDVVSRHHAKVYGKAAVGAPPMSVPHLDARIIDGTRAVLFGPFAGTTPKFLKEGSFLDLPASLRLHNLWPMIHVGFSNFELEKYLAKELFRSRKHKIQDLQEFAPSANGADWSLSHAGQRAQIIKPGPNGKGVLQFGTEAIVSGDRSIAAVLGASPGASTAFPLILDLLERSFPEKLDEWKPKLVEIIPSYGTKLSDNPDQARTVLTETAATLKLAPPTD